MDPIKPGRTWVVRAQCINKHDQVMFAFDPAQIPPDMARSRLCQTIQDRVHTGALSDQCRTCGSRVWLIETGPLEGLEEVADG